MHRKNGAFWDSETLGKASTWPFAASGDGMHRKLASELA